MLRLWRLLRFIRLLVHFGFDLHIHWFVIPAVTLRKKDLLHVWYLFLPDESDPVALYSCRFVGEGVRRFVDRLVVLAVNFWEKKFSLAWYSLVSHHPNFLALYFQRVGAREYCIEAHLDVVDY
jgi:hypothetical protein